MPPEGRITRSHTKALHEATQSFIISTFASISEPTPRDSYCVFIMIKSDPVNSVPVDSVTQTELTHLSS